VYPPMIPQLAFGPSAQVNYREAVLRCAFTKDAVVAGYWLSTGRYDLASQDPRFDARRCCQLQLVQIV